jgi:DNA-directed RNA polymerase subunit RPC12/RpoP
MEERTFHGAVTPQVLTQALLAEFDRAGYQVQSLGDPDHTVIQIASQGGSHSGGQTSITVHLIEVEDGVLVRMGQQAWFGVAASLGMTALAALRNPFSLVGRLDDLAQDLSSIQLTDRIWACLGQTAESLGASHEISQALRRVTCAYCGSANPVGSATCVCCGAPMGAAQPVACPECGYVLTAGATRCPKCGTPLAA